MSKSAKGLSALAAIVLVVFLAVSFFGKAPSESQVADSQKEAPVVQQTNWDHEPEAATPPSGDTGKAVKSPEPQVAKKTTKVFKDGVDYRALDIPVQTDAAPGQVEVVSVFWYGCPHCYSLEPIVSRWHKLLPADVSFVQMPGFFSPNLWQTHAQLYYTVLNMGIADKVHAGIFNEVQNKRNLLQDSGSMADFLNRQYGVDKKAFTDQFNSFGVNVQLQQAFSKLKGYHLSGVPALIIDGRYVVEPGLAGSLDNMPVIAEFLIDKVKRERAAKSKES